MDTRIDLAFPLIHVSGWAFFVWAASTVALAVDSRPSFALWRKRIVWILCTLASIALSHWHYEPLPGGDVATQLRIPAVMAACIIVTSHPALERYFKWGVTEVFAGIFLSLFLADVYGALLMAMRTGLDFGVALNGVGGAGMSDGLVLVPVGVTLVYWLINLVRRRGDITLSPALLKGLLT